MSRPITVEVRELRERNVDLIIGRGILRIPEEDLHAEVLFEEPLIVVAGSGTRWAGRRKIALSELIGEKWILFPSEEAPGLLVAQAFHDQGLELPQASVTTSSFHLREILLMTGGYLTWDHPGSWWSDWSSWLVVPASVLRVFNANNAIAKALPINLGIPGRPVAVFTLKNRTLSPVVELFIACIRAAARLGR